jgi:hypothetical protein
MESEMKHYFAGSHGSRTGPADSLVTLLRISGNKGAHPL